MSQYFCFNQSRAAPPERIANNLCSAWRIILDQFSDNLRNELCRIAMVVVSESGCLRPSGIAKRPLLARFQCCERSDDSCGSWHKFDKAIIPFFSKTLNTRVYPFTE